MINVTDADEIDVLSMLNPEASYTSEQACAMIEYDRSAQNKLDNVDGDLLPKIGEKVLIHLVSMDRWVVHTCVGYYVWGDLVGNRSLQRVFIRVADEEGYLNARMLQDVRKADGIYFVRHREYESQMPVETDAVKALQ